MFTGDELTLSPDEYNYCDAHTYGEWMTKPATLRTDGIIIRQCENCSRYEKQKFIHHPAKYTFAAAKYNGKVQRPKLTVRDPHARLSRVELHRDISETDRRRNRDGDHHI